MLTTPLMNLLVKQTKHSFFGDYQVLPNTTEAHLIN